MTDDKAPVEVLGMRVIDINILSHINTAFLYHIRYLYSILFQQNFNHLYSWPMIYGIDIGGTTVKMGLFDGEGEMLDKWEIETRKEDSGSKILPDKHFHRRFVICQNKITTLILCKLPLHHPKPIFQVFIQPRHTAA